MAEAQGHPFRLVNIGRSKFCGDVFASSGEALLRHVRMHLMSRDVWISGNGSVFAGMHSVGRVEPIGDVAAAAFASWCEEVSGG